MTYKISFIAQVTGLSRDRFELSKSVDGEATLRHLDPDGELVCEVRLPPEALRALIHQMPVVFPESATERQRDDGGLVQPHEEAKPVSLQKRRRRTTLAAVPAASETQPAAQRPTEEEDQRAVSSIDRRTGEVIE